MNNENAVAILFNQIEENDGIFLLYVYLLGL